MKELSTEEMNSVRGGQDINAAAQIGNENLAEAANVAEVGQTNLAGVQILSAQANFADVDQSIRQNVGNIVQRA
jgi:hypothetical protein